ncbi:conjugal transfer protein TraI [Niabella sp. CC-SYL272]|uniref:conjugal transfer protein TraI n=1 Tax=Niabella agricola TaxID=2891571 RepID=UPI001F27B185|nr:conjugal transfer protein TraI [Niabella agricola]MCF3109604.1 conjugal transfer protein TraI [Niabella agricola]
MKKLMISMLLGITLVLAPTQKSHAIVWVVVKEAIKKALKAADLAIQRLQNKTIGLQNAQKQIENTMSKLKLKQISEWAEKQKKLFEKYYDELAKVKNTIATYKKARQIIEGQLALVEEYKRAWGLLRQDKHFSPEELAYMYRVYAGILESSLKNVEQLYMVISSYKTTMTDGKRLELISATAGQLEGTYSDLKKFNNQNFLMSLARSRDAADADMIRKLYGLQ